MKRRENSHDVLVIEDETDGFTALSRKPVSAGESVAIPPASAVTARFHGLDRDHQPLISGVAGLPGEVIAARSTVPLLSEHVGATLVVVFEQGDVRRPIVVGLLEKQRASGEVANAPERAVSVEADGDRLVLTADREIVLRCGQASITLTKAGKVLIHGAYVSSRSSGVNRIKGGSVQIN
jgi:hypothetical protein